MTYNVYDAFAIKDDIKRGVYLHKYFWTKDIVELDRRIMEYIELHNNKTFVESSEDYVQALYNIMTIVQDEREELKNHNYMFYTALVNFCNFATEKEAWTTVSGWERNDFEIWIRKEKLVSLLNKIRND